MEIKSQRGGRITSLRLRGEELLDQGIGVDDLSAEGFVEGGAQGWDEMVPNVDATESLPDHGEAWRLPWTVGVMTNSSIYMRCTGRVVPWEIERRIELSDARVLVSYVYTNRGLESQYAYWCAHPLFRFEGGMEIGLPGGERLAELAPGTSTKVFLPKGSVDRVRLGWQSGSTIELAWDVGLTPLVAVWVCNGDLGGYRQIAVEPATGGNDGSDSAAPPPLLKPGEQFAWWLEVRECQ
jgi:galactose mutarotase-like enzyme